LQRGKGQRKNKTGNDSVAACSEGQTIKEIRRKLGKKAGLEELVTKTERKGMEKTCKSEMANKIAAEGG